MDSARGVYRNFVYLLIYPSSDGIVTLNSGKKKDLLMSRAHFKYSGNNVRVCEIVCNSLDIDIFTLDSWFIHS